MSARHGFTFKNYWLKQVLADADLLHVVFKVAFVIADHVNQKTGEAWPSMTAIAAEASISESSARRCVQSLSERGYLEVIAKRGRGHSNHYRLVLNGASKTCQVDTLCNQENLPPTTPFEAKENLPGAEPFADKTCQPWMENLSSVAIKPVNGERQNSKRTVEEQLNMAAATEKASAVSIKNEPRQPADNCNTADLLKNGSAASTLAEKNESQPLPKDSKPAIIKVSGRQPSPLDEDPKAVLFNDGAAWLSQVTGGSLASSKNLIGKMLKAIGHDDAGQVLAVMRDAKRLNVADPRSWIMAALKARASAKFGMAAANGNGNGGRPSLREQGLAW
jgi:IclR helix-turn-helix domain